MDNRDTTFPFTDTQVQRFIQLYDDLSGECAGPLIVLWSLNLTCHLDTVRTNPNMIPALVWHIARAMRKIEGFRERYRATAQLEHGFNYAPPVVDLKPKTWYLHVAESILMVLLLGTYNLYWKRLQSVRQYQSVHLRKFHAMLEVFLTEWSGESDQCHSKVSLLSSVYRF